MMKKNLTSVIGMAIGTAAFAVLTGQALTAQSQGAGSATQTQTQTQTSRAAGDQQVTVTGCIQREADYRRTTDAGRGGVAGTGIGAGNEFVLASAMMSTGSAGAATSASGAGAPAATGTSGTSSTTAYELTGSKEGDAAAHVGKRVEIMGMLKGSSSAPAGGPTANAPLSQDLQLRELEVSSIRETTGTCAATTAPAR